MEAELLSAQRLLSHQVIKQVQVLSIMESLVSLQDPTFSLKPFISQCHLHHHHHHALSLFFYNPDFIILTSDSKAREGGAVGGTYDLCIK